MSCYGEFMLSVNFSFPQRGGTFPISPLPSWSYGTNYYGTVGDNENIPWEANSDEGGYNSDLLLTAYIGRICNSADSASAKKQTRRLTRYVIEQIVVIDRMSWVSSKSQ